MFSIDTSWVNFSVEIVVVQVSSEVFDLLPKAEAWLSIGRRKDISEGDEALVFNEIIIKGVGNDVEVNKSGWVCWPGVVVPVGGTVSNSKTFEVNCEH